MTNPEIPDYNNRLRDALNKFEQHPPLPPVIPGAGKSRWPSFIVAFVLLAVVGAGVYVFLATRRAHQDSGEYREKASKARDEGKYDVALSLLDQASRNGMQVNPIKSELTEELTVNWNVRIVRDNKLASQPIIQANSYKMGPNDSFYFNLSSSHPCFLYIVQATPDGDLVEIWPGVKRTSPFGFANLRVPSGFGFLKPPEKCGEYCIYLIAARWQHEKIEALMAQLRSEQDPNARQDVKKKLLQCIDHEKEWASQIGGLVFGKFAYTTECGQRSLANFPALRMHDFQVSFCIQ
jgi:hypothetical protein